MDVTAFQTFHSLVWDYLVKVHDKSARLFGLRYLECLQAQHRGEKLMGLPRPQTPAQGLVQSELDRIYQEYYARNSTPASQGLVA
jgi:hypothetical protein